MNKERAQNVDDTFGDWDPTKFNRDANYQRTIRSFTSALINGDVLDVGCGSRIFCDLRRAQSWTGIDISERMLRGIEFVDDIGDKQLFQGDVLDLEFPDHHFDTVTGLFLLHHLGRSSRQQSATRTQRAFSEIFRVLKPGGRFLLVENCRGFLEEPYHCLYSALYPVTRKLFGAELPYFWKTRHYLNFGRAVGFNDPLFIHIPIMEKIYQPVLGVSLPPVFSHDFFQRMTAFDFVKPIIER